MPREPQERLAEEWPWGDEQPWLVAQQRRYPWIEVPFPATVRGEDISGESFQERTVLDSLSASGLSLRLVRTVGRGARLFVAIQLSNAFSPEATTPWVAMRSRVVSVEPRYGGVNCLVLTFIRHRFFYVRKNIA